MGMQVAKATDRDMEAAMTIAGMLCDVDRGFFPRSPDEECGEYDPDNVDHLKPFHDRVMSAYDTAPGGMNRVVFGFHAMMCSNIVDLGKDHLALHPRITTALDATEDCEEEVLP